jgi:hypothetical protein
MLFVAAGEAVGPVDALEAVTGLPPPATRPEMVAPAVESEEPKGEVGEIDAPPPHATAISALIATTPATHARGRVFMMSPNERRLCASGRQTAFLRCPVRRTALALIRWELEGKNFRDS